MGFSKVRFTAGVSTLGAAVLLALALAPAALAQSSSTTSGVVGTWALDDSSSYAGAICFFKPISDEPAYYLAHLYVNPPDVYAARGLQTVGWGFQVERRHNHGAWITTFTSAIQKTTATHYAAAKFGQKSVRVAIPSYASTYTYRVIVDMFWYAANGAVTGSASAKDVYYDHEYSGIPYPFTSDALCQAVEPVPPG